MIVRNIEAELRRFFQSHEKKALLVTGARQVGKTYIIEALGRQAARRLLARLAKED